MVSNFNTRTKKLTEHYNESQKTSKEVLDNPMFRVSDKTRAEYDMWVWIYQEVANLRLEVSRLGSYVRINNKLSPTFLDVYHSHIYSLLIPVSTILPNRVWNLVDNSWLQTKKDIIEFNKMRKTNPNKKIPFELIRKLDALYRAALLSAQKAGLGIRVTFEENIDKAIENAITGK